MILQRLLLGNMMPTLCLYTAQFPYGNSEQFLETEINYIAAVFEKVYVIPANTCEKQRAIPANVEIIQPDFSNYNTRKGIANLRFWTVNCLSDIINSKNKSLLFSSILRAGFQAKKLYQLLSKKKITNNCIHYTYWFDEQSTLLSILNSQNKIAGFISRAHRFDLYEDRNKERYIPFREFQLKNVSQLILISKNGLEYMENKYPTFKNKFKLSYLGIENNLPFDNSISENNEYLILSCSRVVDIKRVHLIVEALSEIKELKIKWVHFGDGPLLEEVKLLAKKTLPNNIIAEFMGMVPNKMVLEYFKNNFIDCFINVSSSEGLPVSIMEAIGFGIPVIATDVGGTNEITNEYTGVLLEENPSPEVILNAIITLSLIHI